MFYSSYAHRCSYASWGTRCNDGQVQGAKHADASSRTGTYMSGWSTVLVSRPDTYRRRSSPAGCGCEELAVSWFKGGRCQHVASVAETIAAISSCCLYVMASSQLYHAMAVEESGEFRTIRAQSCLPLCPVRFHDKHCGMTLPDPGWDRVQTRFYT